MGYPFLKCGIIYLENKFKTLVSGISAKRVTR